MSIRRIAGVLAVASLMALPARAQDSTEAELRGHTLRQQLEQRFTQRVKEDLGLTDDQTVKLRLMAQRWFTQRRSIERTERTLRQAMAGQLRPGIAANSDSVARLTKMLLDLKVAYAETYRDENKELEFLTPVQRAQYYVLRERLIDALTRARLERQAPGRRWGN